MQNVAAFWGCVRKARVSFFCTQSKHFITVCNFILLLNDHMSGRRVYLGLSKHPENHVFTCVRQRLMTFSRRFRKTWRLVISETSRRSSYCDSLKSDCPQHKSLQAQLSRCEPLTSNCTRILMLGNPLLASSPRYSLQKRIRKSVTAWLANRYLDSLSHGRADSRM